MRRVRFLLLQARNPGDPMGPQEVRCFARALGCDESAIEVFDFLNDSPTTEQLQRADMLLLGGSGHYSAAGETEWLERALDCLREIHRMARPTFASCWGFQAMARAMGGRCINDLPNAELGTIDLELTSEGRADAVFNALPPEFVAQAGHEDHVVELPPDAVLLASSATIKEQAFRFDDRPIYCTQFHPELDRTAMLERVIAYPDYIERNTKISHEEFIKTLRETPEANSLLRRFVDHFFE
jgi:GMP synthase (glutamine-hydrolysing)